MEEKEEKIGEEVDNICFFDGMPKNAFINIVFFLGDSPEAQIKDIAKLRKTCKRFYKILDDNQAINIIKLSWPISTLFNQPGNENSFYNFLTRQMPITFEQFEQNKDLNSFGRNIKKAAKNTGKFLHAVIITPKNIAFKNGLFDKLIYDKISKYSFSDFKHLSLPENKNSSQQIDILEKMKGDTYNTCKSWQDCEKGIILESDDLIKHSNTCNHSSCNPLIKMIFLHENTMFELLLPQITNEHKIRDAIVYLTSDKVSEEKRNYYLQTVIDEKNTEDFLNKLIIAIIQHSDNVAALKQVILKRADIKHIQQLEMNTKNNIIDDLKDIKPGNFGSILHLAHEYKRINIVRFLLNNGFPLSNQDSSVLFKKEKTFINFLNMKNNFIDNIDNNTIIVENICNNKETNFNGIKTTEKRFNIEKLRSENVEIPFLIQITKNNELDLMEILIHDKGVSVDLKV
jgi:hypothetical protein